MCHMVELLHTFCDFQLCIFIMTIVNAISCSSTKCSSFDIPNDDNKEKDFV